MSDAWAVLDGTRMPLSEACIPVTDPALTSGWSVYETLAVHKPRELRLAMHLDRLERSCTGALVPMPPREVLLREISLVSDPIPGTVRVRITLTGGGHRIVTGEPVEAGRAFRPVRAVRGPHRDEPFLGGETKHGSRAPWVVAVLRSGVDEVLMVDAQGRFTEGTRCGILASIGGVLWTAPYDGRILQSTTVRELVRLAEDLGIPVRREGPPAAGPWDALYVAATTRRIAPVVELDGVALSAWDPVGRALADRYPQE